METYPQLINYDPKEYEYIKAQCVFRSTSFKSSELPPNAHITHVYRNHYCGYEYNFTYPQTGGKFPLPLGQEVDRHDPRINPEYYCQLQMVLGSYAVNNSMPYSASFIRISPATLNLTAFV